jgi:segregation and condensation protein A
MPSSFEPQTTEPQTTETAPAAPAAPAISSDSGLLLHLDGFEGPLDLLLELARAQKVDLARISILGLVEQFLAVIEGARRVRLELAADWLVMAAWLAWLKSRLLLPPGDAAAEEGEIAAGVLAERLIALEAMRAASVWLTARPQLGQDVFARGAPEDHVLRDRSRLSADVPGLISAYLAAMRRGAAGRVWRPAPRRLWTIQDALERIRTLIGQVPDWTSLDLFVPASDGGADGLVERRAALSATFLAGLELARSGAVRLGQHAAFGPILVGPAAPDAGMAELGGEA